MTTITLIEELPILPQADQELAIQLGNTDFLVSLHYNERAAVWLMDLYDGTTNGFIAANIALVLGADLLAPYNLGIGSLFAFDMSGAGQDAGEADLGDRVKVYRLELTDG